jgi:hypothetical protein
MGISLRPALTAVFALGVGLAGLAGVMSAPLAGVQPAMGNEILTATFVVVVIGGLGSFWGVVVAGLLAGLAALSGPTDARAESVCKPALAISDVRLSAMQPPTLQRKWTALVTVDASRCAENSRGTFEIGFSRLKENAPEVDFHERFRWQAPSVKVEFDFWADEAVERYWLDSIAPCSCRR